MTAKRKAAPPSKADTSGKAAPITKKNNNKDKPFRQRIKRAIVWLAVWGLIPIWVAEWLIQHGGLSHD